MIINMLALVLVGLQMLLISSNKNRISNSIASIVGLIMLIILKLKGL